MALLCAIPTLLMCMTLGWTRGLCHPIAITNHEDSHWIKFMSRDVTNIRIWKQDSHILKWFKCLAFPNIFTSEHKMVEVFWTQSLISSYITHPFLVSILNYKACHNISLIHMGYHKCIVTPWQHLNFFIVELPTSAKVPSNMSLLKGINHMGY